MRTKGSPSFQVSRLYRLPWPEHIPSDRRTHGDAVCFAVASRAWLMHRPRLNVYHTVGQRLFYRGWPALGWLPRNGLLRLVGGALHVTMTSK